MRCVVDCSTALHREIPRADSERATRLRDGYRLGIRELPTLDIVPAEVGDASIVAERKGRLGPGRFGSPS